MSLVQLRPEAPDAGVAHLVERHLAKVEVASSSLVTRSKKKDATKVASFLFGPADRGSNRASASAEERPRWGLSVPACVSGRCAARASLVTRSKKETRLLPCLFFCIVGRGPNRASALSFFRRAPGCTCRGRCRAQLFATKERYRCARHRPLQNLS